MNDKYLQYKAIDFAQDDAFVYWVKQHQSEEDWENWLKQHPSQAEEVRLAKQLVNGLQFKEAGISTQQVDALWDKIEVATEAKEIKLQPKPKRTWMYYAIAACLAALVAFLFLMPSQQVQIMADRGERVEHELPDGSVVRLNTQSVITYNKKSWANDRAIELEGEAFFEVEKGNPFIVKTNLGEVEVLGTSFNVNTLGDFVVTCHEGEVVVRSVLSETPIPLVASKGVVFASGSSPQQFDFDLNQRDTWRNDLLIFERSSLKEVFEALENQYNVEISASTEMEQKIVDIFVDLTNPIDSVLNILQQTTSIEWAKDQNNRRISIE